MSTRAGSPPPPRWAERLLRLVLPPGLAREALLGDLHEELSLRASRGSPRGARRWYGRQALNVTISYLLRGRPPGPRSRLPYPRGSTMFSFLPYIDWKVALRSLTTAPFVTAVAVASLALGIGANAAIYSLFDQILLRPLPVQEPERLVNLSSPGPKRGSTSCGQAGECDAVFSYPMFRDLEAADVGLSGLAAHVGFGANLARGDETVSGRGAQVSGSYFPVLGVRPALGRLLGPADDRRIGEQFVAVLGHAYWQNRLGGDPAVLNDTLVVNGYPMTIVGVAPRGFTGTTLGDQPDVFVPITMRGLMSPGFDAFEDRTSYWAYLFGRLEPGADLEQVRTRINTVYAAVINDVEAPLQDGMSEATLERFRTKEILLEEGPRGQSTLHGDSRTPMTLLLGITGVVLLIACANVANLLLARGAGRDQEIAIRASLGAGRRQLVAQLLAESFLLAVLGGLASLVVARAVLGFMAVSLPAEVARIFGFELSLPVVRFAAALSLGTGLLFGLYPALHATGRDLGSALRATAGRASGGRSAARFRAALVVGQLAMAMALLVAAGLFIRSLVNIARVDLGLRAERVVTFAISPELNGYEPARSRVLFAELEEALAAIPGVSRVAAGMVPIISGSNWGQNVSVEGFERGPDIDDHANYDRIGPGYFSTLEVPLLGGRELTAADTLDAPPVAIVNEAFARKFGLDGARAVGKRMAQGATDQLAIEIVGVVQDAKYSDVKTAERAIFYLPYRQNEGLGSINFYLRTASEPDQVLRAVPESVRRLDPNLPVEEIRTLASQVRDSTFQDRMISTLSAAFAVLATLLAAIGLYGVLAFTVAQRTREIGVRIALGADGRRVRAMVLRQVGRLALIGGVLGIVVGLLLGRAASSLLFGLQGHDPLVLAAVVLLLSAVALGAGYLPALRASRVDPMRALRYE